MKGYFCLMLLIVLVSIKPLNADTVTERDPTQPAAAMPATDAKEKEPEPIYILHSTIISPTRRLALIAVIPADSLKKTPDELVKIIDSALGKTNYLRVGDKIGDAIVTVIDKKSVVLSWPGRKQTLYLFEQSRVEKHT